MNRIVDLNLYLYDTTEYNFGVLWKILEEDIQGLSLTRVLWIYISFNRVEEKATMWVWNFRTI